MASQVAEALKTDFTERNVDAGGIDVTLLEAGEGAAVVYIGDGDNAFVQKLAKKFRVVSTSGGEDFSGLSLAMKARRIAAIATASGYATFSICASGEDSSAALHAAADMPEAVQRCVLMGPLVFDNRGIMRDPSLPEKLQAIACHTLALFGTDGGGNTQVVPSWYREHVPNCHLMYVFDAPDVEKDRPAAAASVVIDFLNRGDGFLVSEGDGRIHA